MYMQAIRRIAFSTLITAIFTMALCAQGCIDPVQPDPDCPVHHVKDCCNHDGNNSARITLDVWSIHALNKSAITLPAQTAQTFVVEAGRFRICDQVSSFVKSSAISGPIPIPLALRI